MHHFKKQINYLRDLKTHQNKVFLKIKPVGIFNSISDIYLTSSRLNICAKPPEALCKGHLGIHLEVASI